jgi:hypothetical protein
MDSYGAGRVATYYPLSDLMKWLDGDPFIQIGRHAVVNLQAIERVTHYGDRLYRVRMRDRNQMQRYLSTEIAMRNTMKPQRKMKIVIRIRNAWQPGARS